MTQSKGSRLTFSQRLDKPEKFARDKHSSLSWPIVNDDEKGFQEILIPCWNKLTGLSLTVTSDLI